MADTSRKRIMGHFAGYAAAMVAGVLISMGIVGALPKNPGVMTIPLAIVLGLLGAAMTSTYKVGVLDGKSEATKSSNESTGN
ncbi:MAG: hypothetical protein KDA80_00285 [Planctomycetaceae bacterium]|nr:hypothetical protein [Planctomycetaceae bacterium]